MVNLKGKRLLVTGGAGFLGQWVVRELETRGPERVVVPRSRQHDLREQQAARRLLAQERPEIIIHLAATVGGIGANRNHPGRYFYENAVMGLHLMEEARRQGVAKFVTIGTICSYPKHTPVPFREDDLWHGYPEETNAPYGLAKKMLLVQGQAYRQQYDFNAIYLLVVNLYGPGDNFDPRSSHVIPAMIRKFREAQEQGLRQVTFWGDGSPTREFLHVRDAARGIVQAADRYQDAEPVNLGCGQEISIRELAGRLQELTGFQGEIRWDRSQPNGQPRRCLDTRNAERLFGFRARIPLEEGLRETVDWYLRQPCRLPQAA